MAKGYNGETCSEAIRSLFTDDAVMKCSQLMTGTSGKGAWKESTICQHLMSLIVNLPPARLHWEGVQPFLFLRPDGQFELFDESKHPKTIDS